MSNNKQKTNLIKSSSCVITILPSNVTHEGYFTDAFEQRFFNDFIRLNITIDQLSKMHEIKLVDGVRIIRKMKGPAKD
jgi:hypothetical protein